MDEWTKKRGVKKTEQLIAATGLNLEGISIYTEAATGYYSITAAVAVMAGAKSVHCVAKSNRFGTAEEAISQTSEFLKFARPGTTCEVSFSDGHDLNKVAKSDLITNSNPLRPLNSALINAMHSKAIISLMYEPWEYREGDIDLEAASSKNIWVVGVNEGHPSLKCFNSSPAMLLKGMFQAELEVASNHILLICPNPIIQYLLPVLSACCEKVDVLDNGLAGKVLPANVSRIENGSENNKYYDALMLMDLSSADVWNVSETSPSIWQRRSLGNWDACIQAMGDIKRTDFNGVKFIPEKEPPRRYMGLNPASLGVELVIRNCISGLKAGEEAVRFIRKNNTFDKSKEHDFEWIMLFN